MAATEAATCTSEYRTWMGDFFEVIKERKLCQLTLPGTHDSGAYHLSPVKTPGRRSSIPGWVESLRQQPLFRGLIDRVIVDFSLTQSMSFAKQLDAGIRYLDIRVCMLDGEFYTHHGFIGPPVSSVLAELKTFMCSVTREVVIMHASHFSAMEKPEHHSSFRELVLKYLRDYLVLSEGRSLEQLRSATLEEIVEDGPKVILIYDDVYHQTNPSPHFWPGSLLYSYWANTTQMAVLIREQTVQLASHPGCEQQLFLLQWVSTPQVEDLRQAAFKLLNPVVSQGYKTLRDMTQDGPSQQLRTFLAERKEQINIVVVDFFECSDVVEVCVERSLVYM